MTKKKPAVHVVYTSRFATAETVRRYGLSVRPEPDGDVIKMAPDGAGMVETEAVWIESPLPPDGDWTVAYRVIVRQARAVVAEVRVFPSEPDRPDREPGSWQGEWRGRQADVPAGGLTTRALRSIRLGYDVRRLSQAVAQVQQHQPGLLDPRGWLGAIGLTEAMTTERPRSAVAGRGRPALPPNEYAALAAAYVAAVAAGSRQPVVDVARQFSLPVSRVRARIHSARRLGFLDRGGQGSAGGTLTPAARRLLRQTKRKEGRHGKTNRAR